MTSTNINYVLTYFEFPILTKIHGPPCHDTLTKIADELKANAASVSSDLGGGAYGHVGLILSDEEYAKIPGTVPYTRPVHPGTLTIASGTAQHAATALREDHKTAIKLFREVQDVEKCLIKQLVAAIDPTYLKSLRNRITNSITADIPTIIEHLKTNFAAIEPEEITARTKKVLDISYNLMDPLITIFDEIEDLEVFANAAGNPFTKEQIVNIGLQLLKNTNDFETGIMKWVKKANADKTWPKFKTHFEAAHRVLKIVRGATMKSASYHQANSLTEQVLSELRNVQETVLDGIQQQIQDAEHATPPVNQANSMSTSDSSTIELMKMIEDLKNKIDKLEANNSTPRHSTGNYTRQNTSKYCHTHGACSHKSSDCKKKKDGHKDSATFSNKMGGSTKFCRPSE